MLQPVLSKDTLYPTLEYPEKSDPPCKDKFLVQSLLRSFCEDEALWETRNKKDSTLVSSTTGKEIELVNSGSLFGGCLGVPLTSASLVPLPALLPYTLLRKLHPAVGKSANNHGRQDGWCI